MRLLVLLSALVGFTLAQNLGAFPQRKSWWAKRIVSSELYTAGRLTSTQLKQAADEGFKSVVSLGSFSDETSIGVEVIPDTESAKELVESVTDMTYTVIEDDDVTEAAIHFINLMSTLTKPVLFHCEYSNQSTFISLLYFVNKTLADPTFQPATGAGDVFTIGDAMGFYFRQPELIDVVAEISGTPLSVMEESPPDSPWYKSMWWLLPMKKGIYLSGQIQKNYLPLLEGNIETYVNVRGGAVTNGTPTQEEVTLLNIRDSTGTYSSGGRQSDTRLLNTRVNPARPNEFISTDSEINYQEVNELEYGDEVGYNETIARQHITDEYSFEYLHTPIGEIKTSEFSFHHFLFSYFRSPVWL
eukprot:GHVO01055970.1.p1 GENE.GHVO01055970.1~~GHVO01055970.1.p1  ORF type:complete len:357 (+),score=35.77 GHVO01055970.1:470-1540(+)